MKLKELLKKSSGAWEQGNSELIYELIESGMTAPQIAKEFKLSERAIQIRLKKMGLNSPQGRRNKEQNWEDLFTMARKKKEVEETKNEETKTEPKTEPKKENPADERGLNVSDKGSDGISTGKIHNESDSSESEDDSFKEEVKKSDLVREKEEEKESSDVGCANCHEKGIQTALRRGQKRCHECGAELDW